MFLTILNVCDVLIQEREAFYILARQIFRKVILLDERRLLARWPKSAKVLRKMFNGVENLIKNWDDFNAV